MNRSIIQTETRSGKEIQIGNTRIIPLARATRVMPLGLPIGVIWNRPIAVVAQTPDGSQKYLPIRDFTRDAQLTLIGVGLLGSLLAWLAFGRKTK